MIFTNINDELLVSSSISLITTLLKNIQKSDKTWNTLLSSTPDDYYLKIPIQSVQSFVSLLYQIMLTCDYSYDDIYQRLMKDMKSMMNDDFYDISAMYKFTHLLDLIQDNIKFN